MKTKPKSLTVRAKCMDHWPRLRYLDSETYFRAEKWFNRNVGWIVRIAVKPIKKIKP